MVREVVVVGYKDVGSHKYCVLRLVAGLRSRLTVRALWLLRILWAVVFVYVDRVVTVMVVGVHAIVLVHGSIIWWSPPSGGRRHR